MSARSPLADVIVPLRALFDLMSDGILVTNGSGYRTYSNPALDWLVGQDACEPKSTNGPPRFLPLDQHERYFRYLQALGNGEVTDEVLSLEWEVQRKDRERIPVAIKMLPIRNGGSVPAAVLWLVLATDEANRTAPPAGHARIEELEEALKRITGELQSVGVLGQPDTESQLPDAIGPMLSRLSTREKEVVAKLLEGQRVTMIAEMLCVSPHTVRNHLKSIFRKVGVHSQAELVSLMRQSEPAG